MLRRPLSPCRKMSYPINSRISRKAESGEHFASLASLPLVSFPLNLVNRRLMIARWRLRPASFQQRLPRFCSGHQARRCQFQAFEPVKSAPEPRQEIPLQLRSTSQHPGAKSPSQPQARGEAKGLHPPLEQTLLVAHGGKLFRQLCNGPLE